MHWAKKPDYPLPGAKFIYIFVLKCFFLIHSRS
jgi:hypothetical protein